MDASSPSRRRPKRPADDHHSLSTSPSSQWIRSIQNESFQPKPTAYSPHSLADEDPLMLQQRQCKDKLRALRHVRERIQFYTLQPLDKRRHGEDAASSYSMKISTSMILSGEDESPDWQEEQSDGQLKSGRHYVGIDALGGMEMLLFGFFSRQELLRVSAVCRTWKALARDDLFWEPLLVTPLERYPLRPLLGMERNPTRQQDDVPAILVYMVYQRLKLAQAAYTKEVNDGDRNVHARMINRRCNSRFMELFNRQQARIAQVQADPVSSVHLVCAKANPALRTQEDDEMARMAAELQLQAQAEGQAVPVARVPNVAAVVPGLLQQPVVNVQNRAGVADDEDVFSVADGRNRATLSAWLHSRQRVSERTLRSFLRQMLLAVDALERSNCEHVDISLINIVVHNQPSAHSKSSQSAAHAQPQEQGVELSEADVDMVEDPELETKVVHAHSQSVRQRIPLFQLFLSRRNCQHSGGARERGLDPVLPVDGDVNEPAAIIDLNGEIAHQRQRLAAAEAEAGGGGGGNADNGGLRGVMAGAFRHRLAFPHPTMVSSVIQTAMTVWARGRFVNADASAVLALLLGFPDSFSSGLRSFLEYAKYLIITHSASASKLLRHEYLRCSEAELARRSSAHWSTMPINDVNEYKSKLVAYYGSLPSRVDGLLDDNPSSSIGAQVLEELMPTTILGHDYFLRALEEVHIASDRFVSVVAPSTASSAWVRKLASTQTYTLQRLDLSRARAPMSVLLHELATLPRLTHLRLPRQILRDENLEHLVAALAYTDLLPRLRGLDENVLQAMDRMEKSYTMQLDMVTFLLQKPSASDHSPARSSAQNL